MVTPLSIGSVTHPLPMILVIPVAMSTGSPAMILLFKNADQ